MLQRVGQNVLSVFQDFGSVALLLGRTLVAVFTGNFRTRDVIFQMVKIGVNSLPTALTTAAFVGAVFAIQIASEFVKFGAGKYVGGVMAIAVARELGPSLTAVVIAARVGAAIAAEIGTMSVTEQIDALYAMASNPIKHLVVPRFLACTIMLPILTLFADLIGYLGGYAISVYVVKINPIYYIDTANSLLKIEDILGGLLKAVFFGMIIAIVGCYRGLEAKGGARGVGEATTNAVVQSLISIFIINYFLSLLLFK